MTFEEAKQQAIDRSEEAKATAYKAWEPDYAFEADRVLFG